MYRYVKFICIVFYCILLLQKKRLTLWHLGHVVTSSIILYNNLSTCVKWTVFLFLSNSWICFVAKDLYKQWRAETFFKGARCSVLAGCVSTVTIAFSTGKVVEGGVADERRFQKRALWAGKGQGLKSSFISVCARACVQGLEGVLGIKEQDMRNKNFCA